MRDYWLARTVGNTLPSSVHTGNTYLDVEKYIAPKTGGVDHSGHAGMHKHSGSKFRDEGDAKAMPADHSNHNMGHSSHNTSPAKRA